jgi:ADP-ribose pyrophosphatase
MGKVTDGRSPDECAVGELAEETGFRASRCEAVGTLLACPGWMDQVCHVYLATDLTRLEVVPISDDLGDVEEAASVVVPVAAGDFWGLVGSGAVRDARTIAAVAIALGR